MTTTLNIDVNDNCQLRCPNCAKGLRIMKNTREIMPLEDFRRVIEKAIAEKYDWVSLYNWTEPLLNDRLDEYVAIVKELGGLCDISSNLSLPQGGDLIRRCVLAGLDRLIVSVSGFEQDVYGIYHKGGRIDVVKSHLRAVSDLIAERNLSLRVRLRFLKFDYNREQESLLRDLADSLGIFFECAKGNGDPLNSTTDRVVDNLMRRIQEYSSSSPHQKKGEVCPLVFDQMVLDCRGDVYLCCAFPNIPLLRIGKYLDLSAEEILYARYNHPSCSSCNMPRRVMTSNDRSRLSAAFAQRLRSAPQLVEVRAGPRPAAPPTKVKRLVY